MKTIKKLTGGCLAMLFLASVTSNAQTQTEASTGASVAKKLGMYIFPAKDQSPEQQNKDENDCYKWAVDQSGVDPINPPKVEAQQVDQGPDGSAVKGAAKGAAVGAAVGAICGDAGQGAAVGAVAGGLGGMRSKKAGNAKQQASADQAAQQQQQAYMDSFKKAYTACLEGKGYSVK
jgi:hypothetical protein